jgi:hypothetical protein
MVFLIVVYLFVGVGLCLEAAGETNSVWEQLFLVFCWPIFLGALLGRFKE